MSEPRAKELRNQVLESLKKFPTRDSHSALICGRFLKATAQVDWKQETAALYRALPTELDLTPVLDSLLKQGAEVYFPRIISKEQGLMEWVKFANKGWKKGTLGILEPVGHETINIKQLKWIFTPGLVFGPNGERIGRGAGFYDRALAQTTSSIRVSLAFDIQYCEKVPQASWDQRIDWLLTETQDVRLPSLIQKQGSWRFLPV